MAEAAAGAEAPTAPEDARFDGPGLYLHVPFCSAICPYCDFAVATGGAARRQGFVAALETEIELAGAASRVGTGAPSTPAAASESAAPWESAPIWSAEAPFDTVYLGGGTPSLLTLEQLAAVLGACRRQLDVRDDAWIFLEANPEDVDRARLAGWRRLGVRTLSLGVQSLDAAGLAFLGRRHDPGGARRAVELARETGFDTVSIDLIYGLPGQSASAWRADLEAAIELAPDHLSCYQLTVERGTPFGRRRDRGELVELPEPAQEALFRLTHERLADAGYPAYEVSSFAASRRHRSRHNVKYWHHRPYLGLGNSAHSFDGRRRRWWNEPGLPAYRRRLTCGEAPIAGSEELTPEDLAFETLLLALRTADGLDLVAFRRRHGIDLEAVAAGPLARFCEHALLQLKGDRLVPSLDGLVIADAIAVELGSVL